MKLLYMSKKHGGEEQGKKPQGDPGHGQALGDDAEQQQHGEAEEDGPEVLMMMLPDAGL
jgi:hypothetical protein